MLLRIALGLSVCFLMPQPSFSQSRLTQEQRQQIELYKQHAAEFLKVKEPDLALRELRKILAIDPTNVDARANIGVILFFQGDFAKAVPQLREVLKHQPNLWKIQALLGMCEERIGQPAEAKSDLETAFPHLKEKKLRVKSGMELVQAYYQAGDLHRAAATVSILQKLEPENINILYMAHRINLDLADEAMLTVALVAPKSARMQQLMAEQLARRGNTTGAILHFRQALKIDPHLPGAHFELGEELRSSLLANHVKLAVQQYKAALEEDPFDEKSECKLGDIDLNRSEPKRALAYYKRALRVQSNDSDANLGAAEALLDMGQAENAKPFLLRAARLDPSNPSVHYRLGMLYMKLGRRAEADREFKRFKRLKELKERLRDTYEEMRLRPSDRAKIEEGLPQ